MRRRTVEDEGPTSGLLHDFSVENVVLGLSLFNDVSVEDVGTGSGLFQDMCVLDPDDRDANLTEDLCVDFEVDLNLDVGVDLCVDFVGWKNSSSTLKREDNDAESENSALFLLPPLFPFLPLLLSPFLPFLPLSLLPLS